MRTLTHQELRLLVGSVEQNWSSSEELPPGYSFAGWYTGTEESGTGQPVKDGDALASAADHTLYAHWQAQIYGEQLPDISFSFSNSSTGLGYGSSYRIPYARYRMVFGDNAVARRYYESETYWRGCCGGMVQAAAFFGLPGNEIDIANYKPDAFDAATHPARYTQLFQLGPRSRHEDWNLSLVSLIEGLQIGQINSFDLYGYDTADTPQELWDRTAAFERTGAHPVVAVLEKPRGAHAALCYMAREWTETEGRIYLYDPNYPGARLCYIKVTKKSPDAPYTQWDYDSYTRLTGYLMTGQTPEWLDSLENNAPTQSMDGVLLICVPMFNVTIYDAQGNKVAQVCGGRAESLREDITAVNLVAEEAVGPDQTPVSYFLARKGQYRVVNEGAGADELCVSMAHGQSGVSVETASESVVLTVDDTAGGGLSCAAIEEAGADYSIVLDCAEQDAGEWVFTQSALSGTAGQAGASAALVDGVLMTRNIAPDGDGTDITTRTFSEYVTGDVDIDTLDLTGAASFEEALANAQEQAARDLEQFNESWSPLPEGEAPE